MSAADFVPRLWAATAGQGLLAPSREIIVAHGGLESAWGGAVAARLGRNFFNLTAGGHWLGDIVPGPDKEPDGHGGWRAITQRWRCYPSDVAAVADYLTFIDAMRYRSGSMPDRSALEALLLGDVVQFTILLKEGGYFTSPLSTYQSAMASCLATVRKHLAPAGVA